MQNLSTAIAQTMSSMEIVTLINENREDGAKVLLHKNFMTKVVSIQTLSLTIGFAIALVGCYLLKLRYAKIFFISLCLIYCVGLYHVYIAYHYPNNILFNAPKMKKWGQALLGKEIFLSEFAPKPLLVVNNQQIMRAKYPAIDFHFHLKSLKKMNADELVLAMDKCGIAKITTRLSTRIGTGYLKPTSVMITDIWYSPRINAGVCSI